MKPENQFISSIHKKFSRPVYYEKMCNPYRSGTPDVWYSGVKGDLWVEYKYIPKIPKRVKILPDLSMRQRLWLFDRYNEGRNVAVVLGTPNGGVIYTAGSWDTPLTDVEFMPLLKTKQDIASWIQLCVGDKNNGVYNKFTECDSA